MDFFGKESGFNQKKVEKNIMDGLSTNSLDMSQGVEKAGRGYSDFEVNHEEEKEENPYAEYAAQQPKEYHRPKDMVKLERSGRGFIGAIVGSLFGAVIWILIGVLGYNAVFGGVITAFGAVIGYKLPARDLSVKGCVIAILLIVILTYFGVRANYAIEMYNVFIEIDDTSVSESFEAEGLDVDASMLEIFADTDSYVNAYDEFVSDEDYAGGYTTSMVLAYVFSAITAIVTIAIVRRVQQ
ncbi:MAG: hypothetical protein LUE12_05380 [Ruminococcus sp.]|nr:hypothetical protein [Ruminococcus sp.]